MKKNDLDTQAFFDSGILLLPKVIPQNILLSAQSSVESELKRLKLKVNGKFNTSKLQATPIFQQTTRLGQMIGSMDELDQLFTDELVEFMNGLASAKLRTRARAQLLVSLPHKQEWTLKQANWHLDLKPPKVDRIPGVQAFVLINDVKPRGGGTLALAGSHKLHYVVQGKNAHDILQKNSLFVNDPDKFDVPQVVEGQPIKIVEMCGQAGSVFLMDLRVLHSPSINATSSARIMATNRFLNALDKF